MAKQHTKEFQQEAARIALSSDLSRKQTAAALGIVFSTPSRWIHMHRSRDDVSTPSGTDLRDNDYFPILPNGSDHLKMTQRQLNPLIKLLARNAAKRDYAILLERHTAKANCRKSTPWSSRVN